MNREAMSKWLIILFIVLGAIIIIAFATILFFQKTPSGSEMTTLANPLTNLTDQQALETFDESFIIYLLYSMGAHNLHNPPLSSDTPKIEIHVSDETYSAEIDDSVVSVTKGEISNEDIIITTTKQEAIKMMKSNSYVKTSFEQGLSTVELVAGNTKLAAKGYLGLYEQFG